MYYSLQAYFANGGGPCYIVSVGGFGSVLIGDLNKGLAALENEDEPTLIVFPEAQGGLADADQFTLTNNALAQCNKLQDRFVIADMQKTASGEQLNTSGDVMAQSTIFRNGVTSSSVKYGAAYFPNINTIFDYAYADDDVKVVHKVVKPAGPEDGGLNGKTLTEIKAARGRSTAR